MSDKNRSSVNNNELTVKDKFIRNLATYPSVRSAAIAAGYSEDYANGNLYRMIRGDRFQKELADYYRGCNATLIPLMAQAEKNGLKYASDNPGSLPRFAPILKQIKQVAGLIANDHAPVSYVTIDVQKVVGTQYKSIKNEFPQFSKPLKAPKHPMISDSSSDNLK